MCILYCMIHSSFVFKICCLILYISSYLAGKFQFLKFLHIIQICVQDLLYFLDTVGHCVPVKIKSLCCKLPGTMLLSKNVKGFQKSTFMNPVVFCQWPQLSLNKLSSFLLLCNMQKNPVILKVFQKDNCLLLLFHLADPEPFSNLLI